MQQQPKTEAQRFVEDLEKNKELRREALKVPRQHFLALAEKSGYKGVTGKDLYDAMRERWAEEHVPTSDQVDEEDDPDTCCCSTFSESPRF
jgi:hypothetical protein